MRLCVYLETEVSNSENCLPIKILFVSQSQTIEEILTKLSNELELNPQNYRVWVQNHINDGDIDDDRESSNNNNPLRKLTVDKTDIDGNWRFLRFKSSQTLGELNFSTISIMIEQKILDPSTLIMYWPKDKILNKWKHTLKIGDMCDAKDDYNNWFESIISSVNIESKTITIHFRGWSIRFDRELSEDKFDSELAPLYTQVPNWRENLKIHDLIDYTKNESNQTRKWIAAYVMAIDNVRGTLKLKYRETDGGIFEIDGVDLNGECIVPSKTHVKQSVPNFLHDPIQSPLTNNLSTSSNNSENLKINDNNKRENNNSINFGVRPLKSNEEKEKERKENEEKRERNQKLQISHPEIIESIIKGDIDKIKKLLEGNWFSKGVDPNMKDNVRIISLSFFLFLVSISFELLILNCHLRMVILYFILLHKLDILK